MPSCASSQRVGARGIGSVAENRNDQILLTRYFGLGTIRLSNSPMAGYLGSSLAERFPAGHSANTVAEAFAASAAVSILGSSKVTHRSRLGATSRHIRSAVVSPSSALSINLRVIVSASPSSSASASRVAWFRDSFGLRLGLPLCPARTGAPAVLPLYFQRAQSHPRHYLLIWRTTTQPG